MISKLALGTVQFGLPYGVTNRAGQPAIEAVSELLGVARDEGVAMVDTAHAYGSAEDVLGRCLSDLDYSPAIVTKVPPLLAPGENEISDEHVARATSAFAESLQRLRVDRIHGLMTHRAADLLAPGGEALWKAMDALRETGRVARIGASVYTPEEADALLARHPLGLIQIPSNLYDARFRTSGTLARLKAAGVEVHVRSLFLQGVLLSEPADLPPFMAPIAGHHAAYVRDARARGLSLAAACLAPWLRDPAVAFPVVGCQNVAQLREIIAAVRAAENASDDDCRALSQAHVLSDVRILNPAEWPK